MDVDDLGVDSTLETLINSTYAVYQDANRRTLRTATADDESSQAQYGIVRRTAVRVRTTSEAQAEKHRDAKLDDGKSIKPRSSLIPEYLMDATGVVYPKWIARAGDTLTIRNLSPSLSQEIDRLRAFLLAETVYDALSNQIQPVPEEPQASLDFLLARRSEGF